MFCKNCGKEVDKKAVVCVHCGASQKSELIDIFKEKPIAFVLSIVWIIFTGVGSIKTGFFSSGFSFASFIFIGIVPIVGYWIYHLFLDKKN